MGVRLFAEVKMRRNGMLKEVHDEVAQKDQQRRGLGQPQRFRFHSE